MYNDMVKYNNIILTEDGDFPVTDFEVAEV